MPPKAYCEPRSAQAPASCPSEAIAMLRSFGPTTGHGLAPPFSSQIHQASLFGLIKGRDYSDANRSTWVEMGWFRCSRAHRHRRSLDPPGSKPRDQSHILPLDIRFAGSRPCRSGPVCRHVDAKGRA